MGVALFCVAGCVLLLLIVLVCCMRLAFVCYFVFAACLVATSGSFGFLVGLWWFIVVLTIFGGCGCGVISRFWVGCLVFLAIASFVG